MTLNRRDLGLMLAALSAAPIGPAFAQTELSEVDPNEAPTRVVAGNDKYTRMVAPVTLNGMGPFNFMVDTGANRSCISKAVADTLNLPEGPMISLHTVVATKLRASVKVDRLQVGLRSQRNVNIPVVPISKNEADGVLGVDWLKGRRLVLDFKGKGLEIIAPKTELSTASRVVVPAQRRSGQLTMIDADMNGRPISAMIDSGSEISIGNAALRNLLPPPSASDRSLMREVHLSTLVGERFTGQMGYLPFMRLGGLNLGNVPVVFAESHVFSLWGLKTKPAIILGMDLLTQFNAVALDFGRSTVRFDIA
jgi:predicted aspartyl protease